MKRPQDATCAPSQRISQRAGKRRDADASLEATATCRRLRVGLLACALLITACNLDNPGTPAPRGIISYPVSVAVSREETPRFLYVANSNFDLAFSAGSIQSYDLDLLEQRLGRNNCRYVEDEIPGIDGGTMPAPRTLDAGTVSVPSGTGGAAELDGGGADSSGITLPADYERTAALGNPRGVLCDGRDPDNYEKCCFQTEPDKDSRGVDDAGVPLAPLLRDEQAVDSFATGVAVAPHGKRLYVPISSRARLVYLDVDDDGTLRCGDEGEGRCRRGVAGDTPDEDPDEEFPGQPAAMAVGQLSDLDLHLGIGTPAAGTPFVVTAHELGGLALFVEKNNGAPVLTSVITGLPQRPTSVVVDPFAHMLYVTHAGDPTYISRFGVRASPPRREVASRELLYQSSQLFVSGLANARDIRDVAVDPSNRERLFALVRGLQESVAFLKLDSTARENARVVDVVRVGAGPSKLDYIEIEGRGFVLVTCYDARAAYILDADRRALVGLVRNLAGPFEMTFDAARKLLYVADFRASVVRVVDLSGLVDKRKPPPRIIATLGTPRFQGGLE